MDSKGKVFFSQERVGKNMIEDAEKEGTVWVPQRILLKKPMQGRVLR